MSEWLTPTLLRRDYGCTGRDERGDGKRIWLGAGPMARLRDYEQMEGVDILLEPGDPIPHPTPGRIIPPRADVPGQAGRS